MGRVYAAEHQLLRKKLAIKVLHPELSGVAEVSARFEREAMAAANIGHPNVVAATDFGRLPDGSLFLALEFVEGRTLRNELAAGALGVLRSVHITRQIASALSACHALGIVHRDLKPENVMLVRREEDDDFVKVLDFGIARFSDPASRFGAKAITRPASVFGTPEYMAPEQALGQAVDGRADLFSLGVMLFEMLTGARPYDASTTGGVLSQQLSAPPPSLSTRLRGNELVAALERVVQQLLAREPGRRLQSADALVDALDALTTSAAAGAEPVAASAPPAPLLAAANDLAKASAERKARGLPTYLPGDPLPAFEFPRDGNAASDAPPPPALGDVDDAALTRVVLPRVGADEDGEGVTRLALPHVGASSDEADAATRLALPSVAPPPAATPPTLAAPPTPVAPQPVVSQRAPARALPAGVRARLFIESVRARGRDARRALRRASRALAAGVGQVYAAAAALIDARRERMPRALRALPTVAFVLAPLAALTGLVLLALWRSSASSPPSEVAARAPASAASIIQIAPLPPPPSASTPAPVSEVDAVLAAVSADLSASRDADAMAKLGRLLTQHPSLRSDERIGALLYRGAQSRDKKAEETAFGLLEGTMARNGTAVLYRLALDRSVRDSVRRAAEKRLQSAAFAAIAPADLVTAVKLRYAESCEQRRRALELAGRVGETRTLEVLRELAATNGCGLSGKEDCYPCLRADGALAAASSAIETRLAR